jgi:hypothetical protein
LSAMIVKRDILITTVEKTPAVVEIHLRMWSVIYVVVKAVGGYAWHIVMEAKDETD